MPRKTAKKKTAKKKTAKKASKKKAPKKKVSKKKAPKKKAPKKKAETDPDPDHMDGTFEDLNQELEEFNFDEPADIPPETDTRADIPPARPPKDMTGLKVSLTCSESGEEIVGKVKEHNGKMLVVLGDDYLYDVPAKEVKVVPEEEAPAEEADKGTEAGPGGDDLGLDGLLDDEGAEQEQVPSAEEPEEAPGEEPEEEPPVAETKGRKAGSRAPAGIREVKLLPLTKIKIPPIKVRKVKKDSTKYKVMLADIKRRGLKLPVEITSFGTPVLVNGGYRMSIYEELKIAEIPCFENSEVKTTDDRLYHSALSNEMSEPMHWVDLAKTFSRLRQGGEYTGGRLARAFGLKESAISRMIKAATLDEEILATAKLPVGEGGYSKAVYEELGPAADSIKAKIKADMKANRPITHFDVRILKKELAKESKDGKEDGRSRGSSGPISTITRQALSVEDTGKAVKIIVKRHEVEVTLHIPWDKNSFKGFSLAKQMAGLVDEAMFAAPSDEAAVGSDTALRKKLNEALAGLSA